MFDVKKLAAIQVGLASSETIRSWSHGEVLKAETINYRSQKPELNGLFCERIFGPSKDYECHCGKYKKIRFQGITCEKCGVEVISKDVRRERMGHIELASSCTHIWYLKGIPSRMSLILDIPPKQLEDINYFVAHVVLSPGTSKVLTYRQFLDEKTARQEFVAVIREIQEGLTDTDTDYLRGEELISRMENPQETFDFFTVASFISKHTNAEFGEGADAIKRLLREVSLNEEFKKITEELKGASTQNRIKLSKRLDIIESFRNSKNRPEWMVLDVLPVIPPDLRPMLQLDGGRFAASDLNDLYRRVISRNTRLKRLIDMNAPYVMLMNEKRMLQEAVDALIDNGRRGKPVTGTGNRPLKSLSNSLKGKQGRFRQNLLGKRVDYSGRSVIAVGPDLKMYQCGLPREMAVQLLRPFIASVLIKENKVNAHRQADKIIDRYDAVVFDILERIIDHHPVLLNRAPTLHRLGIQAFQPKLVDGRAIRLHPLVCTGFNADFDGDQMAVHVPLSKSAQHEALNLMLASNNILGPKDGKPIVTPSQDMVLGNYYLTIEETKEQLAARSKRRLDKGDIEEYERFALYANAEGKVFRNIDEAILAYDTHQVHLHSRVAIRASSLAKTNFTNEMNDGYLITTIGKIIFNLIFPADFPYLNEPSKENLKGDLMKFFVPKGTDVVAHIHKQPLIEPFAKKHLSNIIDEVFSRYGTSKTSAVLDKMKDIGFKYATYSGVTISLSDINVLSDKEVLFEEADALVEEITSMYQRGLISDEERHNHIVNVWQNVRKNVETNLTERFAKDSRNPLFMMTDSGARGNISNLTQLAGMRGLMSNPKGETIELPIKSSLREGLTVSEFFIATHGARKGGADTALKTADSGYLTRRLVDVSQDVIVREDDCGSDHGHFVREIVDTSRSAVIVPLQDRLVGRYTARDIEHPKTGELIASVNTLISEELAKQIVATGVKEVGIRSLFGCQTRNGICRHCYGLNLATGQEVQVGEAVGIMAAQSIGEPGTQLTMRTFHTGGVAGTDITQGLPRVQELVEAREPKGEALISQISGKIVEIEEIDGRYRVVVRSNLDEEIEYLTNYGAHLRVRKGDSVINGGKITEGAISPKKLLEVSDVTAVQHYILKQIQKVYRLQGIGISDKHIEVIIRQMLRKVAIIEGGDTNMLPGTLVEIDEFTDKNEEVLLVGKNPAVARPVILGITKAALQTKSFLSAASFQETTRVLTEAAIKAKTDILHGLKENVITGKLIPAGRGLFTKEQEEDLIKDFSVEQKMKEVKRQYIEAHDRPDE
ncbi:MAG: DNA-directed RNA polymerase subunit beta' [Erysipelotrichia bacterium]|jgi:DNA-directed RNA polymerase subunit beta'|nr:DNA-directed RNA polymerase subunit beta' [Erysipelotrichia bacterium]